MRPFVWMLVGVLAMGMGCRCPMMKCPDGACSVAGTDSAGAPDGVSVVRLAVTATVRRATVAGGIETRVEIANRGKEPYTLNVCPAMELCCVRGLHPMLAYDETGVGLLDLCKVAKPTPKAVYLPCGAAYSFDVTIPPDHLPEAVRKPGKEFEVYFCFDASGGTPLESERIRTRLE